MNHPWFWLFILLMFAGAIAVLIWALVHSSRPSYPLPPAGPRSDPAMDVLRMRFAHGEIDADEYAARAAQLSGMMPPTTVQPPQDPPPT